MRTYFPKILGNEETKTRIGSAIENGKAAHAFLVDGPAGSGKSTLALEIAAARSCERRGDVGYPLPCGTCSACKRIYSGNFPDLKILEKPKDRATIGVDAVKLFREDMFLSATEAECKIYVIKNAETMTPEAQNALLKVLEEPPSTLIIILLADGCDRILTTIKSRTLYIAMARFSEDKLRSHLLSMSAEARELSRTSPERLDGIIMSADGRLGPAMKLSEKKFADENELIRKETLDFISAIGARAPFSALHSAVSLLPDKRSELILSLERIMTALRDVIISKQSESARTLFFPTRRNALEVGADIPIKRAIAVFEAVNEAHELCSKNANVQNLTVNLISKIKLATER